MVKKKCYFHLLIVFHSFLLIKKMEVPPKKEKRKWKFSKSWPKLILFWLLVMTSLLCLIVFFHHQNYIVTIISFNIPKYNQRKLYIFKSKNNRWKKNRSMFSDLGVVYTYIIESVMCVWKYYYVFNNKINGRMNIEENFCMKIENLNIKTTF